MVSQLFFTNLPYNCSDRELKEWIESRGIETRAIRIIRDVVSGASPAFAYADLKDDTQLSEAISMLDGKKMRNQTISATKAALRNPMEWTTARIAKA